MAPHTAADAAADTTCEVCFVAPREGFALVPRGHIRAFGNVNFICLKT